MATANILMKKQDYARFMMTRKRFAVPLTIIVLEMLFQ